MFVLNQGNNAYTGVLPVYTTDELFSAVVPITVVQTAGQPVILKLVLFLNYTSRTYIILILLLINYYYYYYYKLVHKAENSRPVYSALPQLLRARLCEKSAYCN